MDESSIVGRRREIGRLAAAVENAGQGRGSLWFVTGEAGIGKSRLAEEAARLAREKGMRTLWGRCWEAGGAPAYWPWVQILRAIFRTAEAGQLDPFVAPLAQILPELRQGRAPIETTDIGPEQARFQLMDSVSHVLSEVADRGPIAIILEDLHVADVSTILLLDFLAAALRNQPILAIGTFREAELPKSPNGAQLIRTAQQGQRLPLERLTTEEVATFVRRTDDDAEDGLITALHDVTEGHPLFVVEVARLWKSQGGRDHEGRPTIPSSVRQAIQERLESLTQSCSTAIARGTVVGREFDTGLLDASFPEDEFDYVETCQQATDAAVLIEVAPQRFRFSHFLIREFVYESLPEAERVDGHRRVAVALRTLCERARAPRWSEVAHHFAAAGPDSETDASDAYRKAGAQALEQLAFDEAVTALEKALATHDSATPEASRGRIGILIELGHARTRAGDIPGGKADCTKAAALAREIGDSELFARAALEHGTALIFAQVDPQLVGLLEEALQLLDDADSAIRARVMARLAAALQPSLTPEHPIGLARDAIAMAKRVGDRSALLDTLRNGGSAMVDLGDVKERLAIDREHAALAEELGNPIEALRANMRSFVDFAQLGRLDDAYRTVHACERAANELGHPAYLWRCRALHSLRAIWEGDFDGAEEHIEEMEKLAKLARDPNAALTYLYQRMRLLQLRGKYAEQQALFASLENSWRGTPFGEVTANALLGGEHLLAGRREEGLRYYDAKGIAGLAQLGDPSIELCISRLCAAAGNKELADRLYMKLSGKRENLVITGIVGLTLEGPASWSLALLAECLERPKEAREHYEHALAKSRRTGGLPINAVIACEYGEMLSHDEAPEARARALELSFNATEIAEELGMQEVARRAKALSMRLGDGAETASAPTEESHKILMDQIGDSWRVVYQSLEFHLKDMKGVRLLAELIDHPGREYHVLDLSGGKAAEQPIDKGDAGEVLDDEAKQQYQARVMAIREELAEAESWNDAGRAEKARAELEFLSRELANAVGLGGRDRRTGGATERARVNVQRRIRDAIKRIEPLHPKLAKHLSRSVKTGTFCSYEP